MKTIILLSVTIAGYNVHMGMECFIDLKILSFAALQLLCTTQVYTQNTVQLDFHVDFHLPKPQ